MFSSLFFNRKTHRIAALSVLAAFVVSSDLAMAQEAQLPSEQAFTAQPQDMQQDVQTQATPTAAFDLNASVVDGLELSRDHLKQHAPPKKADSVEQALPLPEISPPTAVAAVMPPLPPDGAFSAKTKNLPPMQGSQTPQGDVTPLQSGASVHEYGVDWSTWMSQVADRWYFQLKRLEAQSPYEFYTDGPAQIEFTCYPNGQVGNVVLRRSCGVPIYDRMQIVALLSAVPMPPFPKGTQRMTYTLCQGWEAHARHLGETDYQPGSFGRGTPTERVQQWD